MAGPARQATRIVAAPGRGRDFRCWLMGRVALQGGRAREHDAMGRVFRRRVRPIR